MPWLVPAINYQNPWSSKHKEIIVDVAISCHNFCMRLRPTINFTTWRAVPCHIPHLNKSFLRPHLSGCRRQAWVMAAAKAPILVMAVVRSNQCSAHDSPSVKSLDITEVTSFHYPGFACSHNLQILKKKKKRREFRNSYPEYPPSPSYNRSRSRDNSVKPAFLRP